jgi:hypothetical protein
MTRSVILACAAGLVSTAIALSMRAARAGRERRGDVMVPKPVWIAQATGTTHGSACEYDRRE